jgi:hypothetical protein
MNEAEVFVLADRALNSVVAQIRDDQWDRPMPPTFVRRSTAQVPTLREILNYHAYVDAWVPDVLAGKTMADGTPTTTGVICSAAIQRQLRGDCRTRLRRRGRLHRVRPPRPSPSASSPRASTSGRSTLPRLRAHDIAG